MTRKRGTWHTVEQGETLTSLAGAYGVFDWRIIWKRSENASLRRARQSPQILAPGDRVFIPAAEASEYSCAVDQKHVFRLKAPGKSFVSVILKDQSGALLADCKYQLTLGGEKFQGRSGRDGRVAHEAPPEVAEGALEVWPFANQPERSLRFALRVGHLDPIESTSGVQARLNNLGFAAGDPDGLLNQRTQEALRLFQRSCGLEATGDLDERTRDQLARAHEEHD